MRLFHYNSWLFFRDLYYNNVELFDKQVTLNCLLDDIAVKFEVPRRCLHVVRQKLSAV